MELDTKAIDCVWNGMTLTEEVTTAMTLMGSVSPCRKTYENYEVLDTYPWLVLSRDCISNTNCAAAHERVTPGNHCKANFIRNM